MSSPDLAWVPFQGMQESCEPGAACSDLSPRWPLCVSLLGQLLHPHSVISEVLSLFGIGFILLFFYYFMWRQRLLCHLTPEVNLVSLEDSVT